MSGIYIPGLKELSCDDCFWGIGSRMGCHATPEAVTRKINGRAADCPLIFIGSHGRLVDADALPYTRLYKDNWIKGTGREAPAVWKEDVDFAPTVIPADEEAAE
jgi:hypothetical protein